MPDVQLGNDSILMTLAVILILCNVIAGIWKGVEAFRKLSGRDRREQELKQMKFDIESLKSRLDKVEERLDRGEELFDRITRDNGQIMDVLDGLLMHFISGNDKEKLREVKADLDRYKNHRNGDG